MVQRQQHRKSSSGRAILSVNCSLSLMSGFSLWLHSRSWRMSAGWDPTGWILSACHSTVREETESDSGLSCYWVISVAANSSDGGMMAVHMRSLTPERHMPWSSWHWGSQGTDFQPESEWPSWPFIIWTTDLLDEHQPHVTAPGDLLCASRTVGTLSQWPWGRNGNHSRWWSDLWGWGIWGTHGIAEGLSGSQSLSSPYPRVLCGRTPWLHVTATWPRQDPAMGEETKWATKWSLIRILKNTPDSFRGQLILNKKRRLVRWSRNIVDIDYLPDFR